MLMIAVKNLVLTLMASLLVITAPGAMAQSTEGVAALVNDEPITTVDVRNRMRLIIASTGLTQLDPATLAQIQSQAIRGLVDETLQLQAAREYEIDVTEEEINRSIQDLADRNNTTIATIVGDLERSGVDILTLRHQLEAEIAWQVLVNGRYGSRIRISDQQIEMALERLAASASQPQYRIFELFFEIPSVNREQETVERVIAVMDQLQRGAPFPELARQYSDAPSAANGGDIGWIVASQLPPEVATILPQLMQQYAQSQGGAALSNPVRVPGGYMIVALVAARDGTTTLQYDLVQITVPASAVQPNSSAALTRALAANPTCAQADAVASRIPGSVVTPLGAIGADALLPQFSEALAPLREGGNTGVLQTAAGLQSLIVCERTIAGPGVPSRDDLESQLRGQQLSLHSRRWLRDLRRDGTVEIRD
ncbi:peptidylprolyl isomerase [uncultured Maricaulis sp.]|uniref:peptidylprolyl isomerase n=1 Tax=uncultured Maricaulis sp. TaxID=174710 RepID=UPI0030DDB5C3|tara:strand:- start:45369 stop:46643 length:1275 start_codon:yes stop_codon:yes gene_type:complete